jgi:hypothetical protein
MECQIRNSLVVGTITSITGTIVMILVNQDKKINIKRHLIIFFIIGMLVHLILEYFNFNSLCYDKKCYSNLCRGNYAMGIM